MIGAVLTDLSGLFEHFSAEKQAQQVGQTLGLDPLIPTFFNLTQTLAHSPLEIGTWVVVWVVPSMDSFCSHLKLPDLDTWILSQKLLCVGSQWVPIRGVQYLFFQSIPIPIPIPGSSVNTNTNTNTLRS